MKMELDRKSRKLNGIYKYLFQYYQKIKDEAALEEFCKFSCIFCRISGIIKEINFCFFPSKQLKYFYTKFLMGMKKK